MMNGAHEEQNFWPGYLDALINVMLNLLFLVAVFAMGLVSLTLQSMRQMNQISRLNEQATEAVAALDMDAAQRQAILQKIEKLNIASMVANREELERRRQSLSAHPGNAESSDKPTSSAPAHSLSTAATEAQAEKNLREPNTPKGVSEDKRSLLAELEEQIKDVKNKIAKERAQWLAARPNPSQPLPEIPPEIRTASRAESAHLSAKGGKVGGVRETLVTAIGTKPMAIWEFLPSEFAWPPSRPLPDAVQVADTSATWHLLGFVDPTNARVRREVFARLQAVRNLLIDRGYAKERIQLELRPLSEPQKEDDQAHRLIFMLPPS